MADDSPPTWLLMVHVHPVVEDAEAVDVVEAVSAVVEHLLPGYDYDVSSVYARTVEFIDLSDLHEL